MERRLAAILAADVVGYASLMEADEEGTHKLLKERRRSIIEPVIKKHGGHVFKLTGDGVLVEFPSVVAAVECAVEVQHGNARANEEEPAGPQIQLRIGISIGDIIVDEDDIYGIGVNLAARLQTLAAPGGICVSGAAVDQARGGTGLAFRLVGQRNLKNISTPVMVYEVDHEQHGSGERPRREPAVRPTDRPSLAILPFTNLGGSSLQDYFCDGITRDLIAELSRFRSLFVISANSTFRYRGPNIDRSRVGQELGVRYLGDGSVQRVGNQLRATAELIDAETGVEIWADRYVHDVEDPIGLQDRLARSLASRLHERLQHAETELVRRKPPASLRSYELWLQGVESHETNTPEGYADARRLYQRAIEIDPGFARVYASLAELTYMESVLANWGVEDKDDVAEPATYAQKALALDDQDANGHAVMGWVHMVRRQFAKAARHWEQATALNPNDADIMMWRATSLAFLGQPEKGVEAAKLAMQLNPFHPDWYLSDYAVVLFFCRRFEEMLAVYDVIPELFPHTPAWRAAAYAHLGRMQEAQDRAAAFARNIAAIWAGPPEAGARDYGRWFMRCIPLARAEEQEIMREGLRRAGLLD